MTVKLRDFFNAFRLFMTSAGRSILFTSLFYTLWLVISGMASQKFDLHSFSGRMIGSSTLEGYDVNARIGLFYRSVVVLLATFPLFCVLGFFIFRKSKALFYTSEVKIINFTSLAGIFLFLFQAFDFKVSETLEIIYFMHKLMLAGILLRCVFFKKAALSVYHYAFILAAALAIYFFTADCFSLCGAEKNPDLYIVTFIIACVLLIFLNLFLTRQPGANRHQQLNVWLYAGVPAMCLPLISFLKDEVFLILKANGMALSSPAILFAGLVAILILIIDIRYHRAKNKGAPPAKELVATAYFPLLIFSLLAYTFYSVFADYSDELFESGNIYLPIMEFKLFGVIPTLEKFNSHLLSDYFFSAIYTFFNGMNGREIRLYDFLMLPVSYTLYYYLMYYVSRNAFVALFSILLLPFAPFIMTDGYSLAILAIACLYKVLASAPSLKNYLALVFSMVALVVWRIDLGYTCIVVMPLILLFYHVASPRFKINWLLLIKASAIVGACVLVFFTALSIYRDKNLFLKTLYALNYFSSAQTYGYTTLGWANLPAYKMHYYVFPVLVGLLILALIVCFKSLNRTRRQRVAYLCLLFISVFYFINFNRGLIRHSLMEWVDTFTSAFIYIIIPASVFVFKGRRHYVVTFFLFCGLTWVMVTNYRLPDTKNAESLFERCVEKVTGNPRIDLSKVENRMKPKPDSIPDATLPFTEFILKNTSARQTFIDFTNSPMLFYATQKITPSYFYQNPSCTHNEFLQKKFISDLQEYDAPYLLYANMNAKGYDEIDGVPNTLRHYRMAEYFFNNYAPYIIAGNYCVWKKNSVKDANKKDTVYTYKQQQPTDTGFFAHLNAKADKKYILKITTAKKTNPLLKVFSNRQWTTPPVMFVTDTLGYAVIEASQASDVLLKDPGHAVAGAFLIECDHVPDYYAERVLFYDFKKLPYIWGSFDKNLPAEKVLWKADKKIKPNDRFALPATLDKSSGNTLIITCRNSSKQVQRLHLFFSNTADRNKTILGFDILPSEKTETYAIRISSIYKWYSGNVNEAGFFSDANAALSIEGFEVTKGE